MTYYTRTEKVIRDVNVTDVRFNWVVALRITFRESRNLHPELKCCQQSFAIVCKGCKGCLSFSRWQGLGEQESFQNVQGQS